MIFARSVDIEVADEENNDQEEAHEEESDEKSDEDSDDDSDEEVDNGSDKEVEAEQDDPSENDSPMGTPWSLPRAFDDSGVPRQRELKRKADAKSDGSHFDGSFLTSRKRCKLYHSSRRILRSCVDADGDVKMG
jgi:hypothetical protein